MLRKYQRRNYAFGFACKLPSINFLSAPSFLLCNLGRTNTSVLMEKTAFLLLEEQLLFWQLSAAHISWNENISFGDQQVTARIGATRIRFTSRHLSSTKLTELHRHQFKAALKCQKTDIWLRFYQCSLECNEMYASQPSCAVTWA